MTPRNRKQGHTAHLRSHPENVPMNDGPDGETAMTQSNTLRSTTHVASKQCRRRAFCSVGILAMAGPCSTPLGVLVLSSSSMGIASALATERSQDVMTRDSIREGGADRGTGEPLAPGGFRGNLRHIKNADKKLSSAHSHDVGEDAATTFDGLFVVAAESNNLPHIEGTTSTMPAAANDENSPPPMLQRQQQQQLQLQLPPPSPRNRLLASRWHNEISFDEAMLVSDEEGGGGGDDHTPELPPPHGLVPTDIAIDELRVPGAGVGGQSSFSRVRGGHVYKLWSRALDDQTRGPKEDEEAKANDSTETLLIIWIVVGCGIVTLVVLCIVRKVMDLCMFRNDPTGSIQYSQEEGLAKAVIERLPQTKYKNPAAKGKLGKKSQQHESHKMQVRDEGVTEPGVAYIGDGANGDATPGPGGGGDILPEATSTVVKEGEERDSTEDMCAICLVDYEPGDALRILPGCRHHFHKECIDPWLETKAVCAYCKATVEPNKTACDRMFRWISDRLGIHPVAPSTFQFSSTRRTFTNREVQMLMEPSLPPAYQRSDMDYVGSMVAAHASADLDGGGVGHSEGPSGSGPIGAPSGLRVAAFGSTAGGVVRADSASAVVSTDERQESQGAIVVQPASAPSFTVVPRGFASSSGASTTSAPSANQVTAAGSGAVGERSDETARGISDASASTGAAIGGVESRRGSHLAGVSEEVGVSRGVGSGEEKVEHNVHEEKIPEDAEGGIANQATSRQGVGMHGTSGRVGGHFAAAGLAGGVLEGSLRAREGLPIDGELKVPETEPAPRSRGGGGSEVRVSERFQDVPL